MIRVFWDIRSCCSMDVLTNFRDRIWRQPILPKSTVFTKPHSVTSRRYTYAIYTVQEESVNLY